MFHASILDASHVRSHLGAGGLLRAGSCLLLVSSLLLSVSAFATSLKDVRVGIHPRFTRVVLDSDGPVAFQIERSAGDELQVVLAAAAEQRVIASASGHLRSVRIEPRGDGTAVAKLKLRGTAIAHSHLVLDNPSRLVIDLKTDSTRTAAAPVGHRIGPKGEAPKTPAPSVASDRALRGVAETAKPDAATGDSVLGEAASGSANLDGASLGSEIAQNDGSQQMPPSRSPSQPAPPQGFTGFLPAAIDHPLALGSIGVALLMLLIFLVVRGQRSSESYESSTPFTTDEPFSLDDAEVVSAVVDTSLAAEASDPTEADPLAASSNGLTGDVPGSVGSNGLVNPPDSGPATAGVPDVPVGVANGLHDQGSEDEFPALKDGGVKPPTPAALVPVLATAEPMLPANNGAAVPVMVDERLSGLEERVNDLADAKERLERQVAAQSEELRVQRAAIAHTQRVLRTVVRPEDEASEPVPKVS
jgi:hypothetical protein